LTVDDAGRRERSYIALESERPFQVQAPDLIETQSGSISGLNTSVAGIGTPPIPEGFGCRGNLHVTVSAEGVGIWPGYRRGGAQIGSHSDTFITVHGEGHGHHGSGTERAEDPSRGHLFERLAWGDAGITLLMASGTSFFIDGLSEGLSGEGLNNARHDGDHTEVSEHGRSFWFILRKRDRTHFAFKELFRR